MRMIGRPPGLRRHYPLDVPSESDLHRAIYTRSASLGRRFPHIVLGPGDDCAALRPDPRPLVVTTDQLVENRHFLPPPRTPIDLIARKAIARSVSDIAAMGAEPAWCVAAGVMPAEWEFADELCVRLAHWGEFFGAPVVGGDIATYEKTAEARPLVLTTTVGGHAAKPVTRACARVGDEVYVTGKIGNSFASGRHLMFSPRTEEGLALVRELGESLRAMIDVSDGVGRDAGRIAEASGVGIELEIERVPLHADVGAGEGARLAALGDGEDYELLFVVASGVQVPSEVIGRDGAPTRVTKIGRVVSCAGRAGECVGVWCDGRRADLRGAGWEHR